MEEMELKFIIDTKMGTTMLLIMAFMGYIHIISVTGVVKYQSGTTDRTIPVVPSFRSL